MFETSEEKGSDLSDLLRLRSGCRWDLSNMKVGVSRECGKISKVATGSMWQRFVFAMRMKCNLSWVASFEARPEYGNAGQVINQGARILVKGYIWHGRLSLSLSLQRWASLPTNWT